MESHSLQSSTTMMPRENGLSGDGHVHVVGIGGCGLRGMAQLLSERGAQISGSEMRESPALQRLRDRDINCHVGHNADNVNDNVNLLVVSAAVDSSNPEVKAARRRRIPVLKYSECLGHLMKEKTGVAIAGTHGKTTTTAMTALILESAGVDPSYLVGGDCPRLEGGARWGNGPHFVAEACEFDRSFLNLKPQLAVVTNVDNDHLDCFGTENEVRRAFSDFVGLLEPSGLLVINRDDSNSTYLRDYCSSPVVSFGLTRGASDWWAEDIRHRAGGSRFILSHRSGERCVVHLPVPGLHNVRNALAAAALCRALDVPLEKIAKGLERFSGVRRRFDVLANGGVTVVDDYAHHPTEIEAALQAARERFADRRLVAVFEPHQHSRLKMMDAQFAEVLSLFDDVVVLPVFRSRDSDEDARTVQSDGLARQIRRIGTPATYVGGYDAALRFLGAEVDGDAAVMFLGAGTVTDLARSFADSLQRADA